MGPERRQVANQEVSQGFAAGFGTILARSGNEGPMGGRRPSLAAVPIRRHQRALSKSGGKYVCEWRVVGGEPLRARNEQQPPGCFLAAVGLESLLWVCR